MDNDAILRRVNKEKLGFIKKGMADIYDGRYLYVCDEFSRCSRCEN